MAKLYPVLRWGTYFSSNKTNNFEISKILQVFIWFLPKLEFMHETIRKLWGIFNPHWTNSLSLLLNTSYIHGIFLLGLLNQYFLSIRDSESRKIYRVYLMSYTFFSFYLQITDTFDWFEGGPFHCIILTLLPLARHELPLVI